MEAQSSKWKGFADICLRRCLWARALAGPAFGTHLVIGGESSLFNGLSSLVNANG